MNDYVFMEKVRSEQSLGPLLNATSGDLIKSFIIWLK